MSSRIPSFFRLPPAERRAALAERGFLSADDAEVFASTHLLEDTANHMVENVIGTFELPSAVAVNLLINGEDRVAPMVVEEPSVVAAVSHMARITREAGGIEATSDPSVMIGQVQVVDVPDIEAAISAIEEARDALLARAESVHPRLVARGGGPRDLRARHVRYDEPGFPPEDMIVVHFHLDCVDAMGANMVNTVAEALSGRIEDLTGGTVALRILSNLASERLSRAKVRIPPDLLAKGDATGPEVARDIARAWRFAWADPHRAATHNKGVMNGIDSVALATGNDWRAIEAGVHAWCCRDGQYRPCTTWRVDDEGFLVGEIEVPLQFGTVGGSLRVHDKARANLRIAGDRGARDLAALAAAVGLIQNLGALRALATEGIQAGHMRMHARSVAAAAGAEPHEIQRVVARLCAAGEFNEDRAKAILAALRAGTDR